MNAESRAISAAAIDRLCKAQSEISAARIANGGEAVTDTELGKATFSNVWDLIHVTKSSWDISFEKLKKIAMSLRVKTRWVLFGNEGAVEWIGGKRPDDIYRLSKADAREITKWLQKLRKRTQKIIEVTRTEKGLGIGQYVETAHISTRTIYSKGIPTLSTAEKVARAAGLTLEEAMFEKDFEQLIKERLKCGKSE